MSFSTFSMFKEYFNYDKAKKIWTVNFVNGILMIEAININMKHGKNQKNELSETFDQSSKVIESQKTISKDKNSGAN